MGYSIGIHVTLLLTRYGKYDSRDDIVDHIKSVALIVTEKIVVSHVTIFYLDMELPIFIFFYGFVYY